MSGNIVCFGEILWDNLPTEKIAGGAPMNVAIRLQSLGVNTKIISKIGIDKSGDDLSSKIIYTNDYKKAIAYGCAVGALVASHKGANPEILQEEIERFWNN